MPEYQRQNEGIRNRGSTMPVAGALLWVQEKSFLLQKQCHHLGQE